MLLYKSIDTEGCLKWVHLGQTLKWRWVRYITQENSPRLSFVFVWDRVLCSQSLSSPSKCCVWDSYLNQKTKPSNSKTTKVQHRVWENPHWYIMVANGKAGILRKISCFRYIRGIRVDQVFGIIWQNKRESTSGRAALSHEVQSYVWNNLLHFAKLPLPRVGEAVTEHT